jgi:hypothetical protein
MYAVAGIYLGRADHLPVVEAVGRTELWVALTVWLVVFVAMARHVVNTVIRPGLGSGDGSTSAARRPTLGGRTNR